MMSTMSSEIQKLDNRHLLRGMWMRFGNRKGYPHFIFDFSGKRIVYCYIRKNACSAFKGLIVGLSNADPKPQYQDVLQYILQHHRCQYPQDFTQADHIIFVHRDPIDRIISLFINKFIQQRGNTDIFNNYRAMTGSDPRAANFRDFVESYLPKDMKKLDPHVIPQFDHLLPVVYTESIPLARLHEAMAGILNEQIADTYFSQKVNATISSGQDYDDPMAAQIPAIKLRQTWLAEGTLPTKKSFIDNEMHLDKKLQSIYAKDAIFQAQ
ncbi:MAG: sulfotransferase family 2 domain-containing protein [Leptolyngbyaceae cyanobacterium]